MNDTHSAAVADLKRELTDFSVRLAALETRLEKVEPMVTDLRVEVAELMEQVSRGTRISLETQGEVREAFKAIQIQNALILDRLGLSLPRP